MKGSRLSVVDWLLLLIGGVAITVLLAKPNIAFNYTNSIPKGFYLYVDEVPQKGDYTLLKDQEVLSFASKRGYIAEGTSIGKPIVGVSGDTIIVTGEGVTINGQDQPTSSPMKYDSKGRRMPAFRDSLILSTQEVFLLGNTKKSFDSRYFGPVRNKVVSGKLKPIFTF